MGKSRVWSRPWGWVWSGLWGGVWSRIWLLSSVCYLKIGWEGLAIRYVHVGTDGEL